MEKDVAKQAGNNHPTSIPTGVFKTSDGYINIATTGGRIWNAARRRSARPSSSPIPTTPPPPARSKNRDALEREVLDPGLGGFLLGELVDRGVQRVAVLGACRCGGVVGIGDETRAPSVCAQRSRSVLPCVAMLI